MQIRAEAENEIVHGIRAPTPLGAWDAQPNLINFCGVRAHRFLLDHFLSRHSIVHNRTISFCKKKF